MRHRCPATEVDTSRHVPVGVVLTGGRSRRFGRDKALVEVDGTTLAARVAAALAAGGCRDVVAVGVELPGLDRTGLPLVTDRWPGAGPLGGVLTALDHAGTDVVVAACDLVDLDPATVAVVIEAGSVEPGSGAEPVDVAIATVTGRHVALARWNRSARQMLRARFEAGERSWKGALDSLQVRRVEVSPSAVMDVDRPADLSARRASGRLAT